MLTQTMIKAVPLPFFTWMLHRETTLRRQLQRLALRKTVARAFERFACEHPCWANSLFDEHFLTHRAAPLLDRYVYSANRLSPAELAAAWSEQCPSPNAVARDLSEVVAAAADFLHHLEAELAASPVAREARDVASSDAAAARGAELFAQALREDSNLEMDWLWFATQVTCERDRHYCLKRALAINPHSELARRALAKLSY